MSFGGSPSKRVWLQFSACSAPRSGFGSRFPPHDRRETSGVRERTIEWQDARDDRRAIGSAAHDRRRPVGDLSGAVRSEGSCRNRQLWHVDGVLGYTSGWCRRHVRRAHGPRSAERLPDGPIRRDGHDHGVRARSRDRVDDRWSAASPDRPRLRLPARARRRRDARHVVLRLVEHRSGLARREPLSRHLRRGVARHARHPRPNRHRIALKILYIIGPTRSGSTLLSRVLNEAPGIVAVGEVVSLDVAFQSCRAQRLGASASGNFVGNDARENAARRFSGLCGCGCPLTDCTVWAHVDRTVFGDPPDYSPWSWTASRPPLRTFLHNGADRWLQSVGTDLAPVAESIYRELARATDARVLVDDSKTPLFGYFLAAQPWAEVIPVRLVRDPRATADSWARPKPYPGMLGGHFPTHPAHVSAVDWLKRV